LTAAVELSEDAAVEAGSETTRAPAQRRSDLIGVVLGAATVTMGLIAGFFYAYAVSVMPGLADADDRTLVDAMQQINEAVENPFFFLTFLGAPLVTAVAAVLQWRCGRAVRWVVAAFVLYAIAFLATFAFNIPLNNELADAGDPGQIDDLGSVRDDYYTPWVAWNIVRTVASTAALACLARALVLHGRLGR